MRSYREAISWLFGLQRFGIKLGLTGISRLLELLGNPHHRLSCIHIAGTNGKGSTAAFLHSVYCRAGYRPGLYTSPHLVDFSERIIIAGRPIARTRVTTLAARLRDLCERNSLGHITFFECVTALALVYFAEQGADPIILETGLGGRLDATNVVDPLVSIITSISREHTAILGPTLTHIAREKAGIIKAHRFCISAVTASAPRACIRQTCRRCTAPLLEYGHDFRMRTQPDGFVYQGPSSRYTGLRPGLVGSHQVRNASLAVAAVDLLRRENYPLLDSDVVAGIETCRLPGRIETAEYQSRRFVLDGAHNGAAWRALVRTLRTHFTCRRLILIIGVMRDKDMRAVRTLAAAAHVCLFFKPRMERSAGREDIEKHVVFSKQNRVLWFDTIAQCLAAACAMTVPRDMICITGSLFAVGEARELICRTGRGSSSGRIGL